MLRQENTLKGQLVATYPKQYWVIFPFQDVRTNGIPDLGQLAYGFMSLAEIKHGTPRFDSRGIQELVMRRAALAGFARYVVYREDAEKRETLIVHPRNLIKGKILDVEERAVGFNHQFVVDYFTQVHRAKGRT